MGDRHARLVDGEVVVAGQHAATVPSGLAGPRLRRRSSLSRPCSGSPCVGRRSAARGITPPSTAGSPSSPCVLLCIIVVTGAAVRLTGSGLGCTDWPRCNDSELVDVGTKHAAIEQVNRLFTGLVAVAVIVAVLGALIRQPAPAATSPGCPLGLVAGVIGQIVLGGITVLVDLHPVAVQSHFLLSMLILFDGGSGHRRARGRECRRFPGPRRSATAPAQTCGVRRAGSSPRSSDR